MEFVILSFATFAIVEAIVRTAGPFDIFRKLRLKKYSKLIECTTCTAIWIGPALALLVSHGFKMWFLYGIGAAGAAIFIDYLADL